MDSLHRDKDVHTVVWCLQAFGGEMTDEQVEGLFQQAGEQQQGRTSVTALAGLLQQDVQQHNLFKVIKR